MQTEQEFLETEEPHGEPEIETSIRKQKKN